MLLRPPLAAKFVASVAMAFACAAASLQAAERHAPADRPQAAPFPRGARCLFIGHSFFIPVARAFDRIAQQNDFPDHRVWTVFSPGGSGAPGALWRNERLRERIEKTLETGEVELLGMTIGRADSEFEDYRRWIDLALKYNPHTQFFIGHCWVPGGTRLPTRIFRQLIDRSGMQVFRTVQRLRKAYPRTQIHYVNYGVVAALMKAAFDAGELHDLRELVGLGRDALFRDDRLGHAGPMLLDVCAVVWLNALYGADLERLKGLAYDAQDVKRIVREAIEANRAYGAAEAARNGSS